MREERLGRPLHGGTASATMSESVLKKDRLDVVDLPLNVLLALFLALEASTPSFARSERCPVDSTSAVRIVMISSSSIFSVLTSCAKRVGHAAQATGQVSVDDLVDLPVLLPGFAHRAFPACSSDLGVIRTEPLTMLRQRATDRLDLLKRLASPPDPSRLPECRPGTHPGSPVSFA